MTDTIYITLDSHKPVKASVLAKIEKLLVDTAFTIRAMSFSVEKADVDTDAPKPTTTRRSREAKPVEEPEEDVLDYDDADDDEDDAPKPTPRRSRKAKTVLKKDVMAAAKDASERTTPSEVRAIFNDFGSKNVSGLDKADYADALAALEALGADEDD